METALQQLEELHRKLSDRKVILRKEYENLPKDTDMREALRMLQAEERECEQLKRESDKLECQIRELVEILKEKKKKALEIAEALYLTCSYDIFKEGSNKDELLLQIRDLYSAIESIQSLKEDAQMRLN